MDLQLTYTNASIHWRRGSVKHIHNAQASSVSITNWSITSNWTLHYWVNLSLEGVTSSNTRWSHTNLDQVYLMQSYVWLNSLRHYSSVLTVRHTILWYQAITRWNVHRGLWTLCVRLQFRECVLKIKVVHFRLFSAGKSIAITNVRVNHSVDCLKIL